MLSMHGMIIANQMHGRGVTKEKKENDASPPLSSCASSSSICVIFILILHSAVADWAIAHINLWLSVGLRTASCCTSRTTSSCE
eukprot:m.37120 g.37120  ORF g.37120 m.37120 type:complete len:84 (-) comp6719_c2_seq5:2453-2704(-)